MPKHNQYTNVEDNFWSECIINHWKEKLENFGFENVEIWFSGFSSQGDGASFTFDNLDLEKFLKTYEIVPEKFKKLIIAKRWFSIICYRYSSIRYVHENSVSVDHAIDFDETKYENSYELIVDFVNWLEIEKNVICKEIYKDLEKEYNYQCSDEAIKEEFAVNGREFVENGTTF